VLLSRSEYRDSGLSPEADEALDVLSRLCGGDQYVVIVGRDPNWIEVTAYGVQTMRHITIGVDGRVMHT
jgi:hypothetical protein